MMGTTTTASQAWAILSRHAREEISLLRLQELCRDNDRVSSLVSVYNTTFTSNCRLEKNVEIIENRILIADLSRQRMTLDTLNHLFRLAASTNLRTFITRLAWGQNNPSHPILPVRVQAKRPAMTQNKDDTTATIPSMHFAMRAPAGKSYEMLTKDGTNALTGIHQEWERIERYSNSIRRGHSRGISGHMIRDVVVVGQGVPMAALQFIYSALIRDERACVFRRVGLSDSSTTAERIRRNLAGVTAGGGARQMHFLTRVDPVTAAAVVADLDPASTLVISIALNGNEETGLATKTLKTWLLNALAKSGRPDHILSKHMMLVTGNDDIANVINKPESVHIIPQHSRCEAFSSTSAACLLPLAVVFGWSVVADFLAGAHDMDRHFVDTNMRHNLPVLMALADIWNECLLGLPTRICTPFSPGMVGYPAFVASLEAQTCSREQTSSNQFIPTGELAFEARPKDKHHSGCSALVVDGGVHGIYDRTVYQSSTVLNNELSVVMDNQLEFNVSRSIGATIMDDMKAADDATICSIFAHADEMAFGTGRSESEIFNQSPVSTPHGIAQSIGLGADRTKGNRPSMLVITGKLDAFACGQMVALAEHRAVVKAHICGLDPFVRDVGSSLRKNRSEMLKDELANIRTRSASGITTEEETNGGNNNALILSTRTILEHYASLSFSTG
ncbi:hypothetical protein FisN_12Hu384 [Fistulifera solaris]|uniref:Glucose-6-phosphate isomerase n=1 Tax=Fistulifera solaris TaxID=1519565 RepID=A0A1Z5KCE1_FISSO|nr:hypothetical protein FisN_12Hu384 [Fistulifera solaris]|eukprot:GAX23802.1 hypothetical protein FisN_12Hu384 [Fistulifera solaris]